MMSTFSICYDGVGGEKDEERAKETSMDARTESKDRT